MSEKINFLSGEVLTATNLNKAFDEKLNANSIDDNSSISMEEGIKLNSSVGIDLNINDSTKILLYDDMCKITGNSIELRADKIDLYKKSGDKHSEIDLTELTKVKFSQQVAAPVIHLNKNYINYSDNRTVFMPNLKTGESDILVGEKEITEIKNEDLKKYWYTLFVKSGTTLDSNITDSQKEGVVTLDALCKKLDGILNDSYYSDRVYVNVTVNDTTQTLKFCGKSNGTSMSYYYFNNTEYKVKLSKNNNGSTTGSVIRSGFNKASVQKVYAGNTELNISTTDATITCYLNDDGQVVKVLSFYMMRTTQAKTIRITKLVLPISIDGFPLYEGSTPTIKSARGVCGVWDTNDTTIKILSLLNNKYEMRVNGSSIEFTFDWDNYPMLSSYYNYPTMIYAEWI